MAGKSTDDQVVGQSPCKQVDMQTPTTPHFGNVVVAFDFMTVRLSELTWAPEMLPGLQLYPAGDELEDHASETCAENVKLDHATLS